MPSQLPPRAPCRRPRRPAHSESVPGVPIRRTRRCSRRPGQRIARTRCRQPPGFHRTCRMWPAVPRRRCSRPVPNTAGHRRSSTSVATDPDGRSSSPGRRIRPRAGWYTPGDSRRWKTARRSCGGTRRSASGWERTNRVGSSCDTGPTPSSRRTMQCIAQPGDGSWHFSGQGECGEVGTQAQAGVPAAGGRDVAFRKHASR